MEAPQKCERLADMVSYGLQKCPFLRNIGEPTSFNFGRKGSAADEHQSRKSRGPIFEDGPSFNDAFRLFHGSNGVVPLSGNSPGMDACPHMSQANSSYSSSASLIPFKAPSESVTGILAASAATISLSAFGPAGPFSYNSFKAEQERRKKASAEEKRNKNMEDRRAEVPNSHEALGSEWLATGNCPIAKTYRALNGMLPLVAKMLTPPSGMKYHCPPAIVAARAALAKHPTVKALRPQALPIKVLAIGMLGMGLNVPLGVWREHCEKFSPQWILAVHAAVPFVAMLRKAVLLPKYAMAFTFISCIIGQTIGARLEKKRLKGTTVKDRTRRLGAGLSGLEKGSSEGVGQLRSLPENAYSSCSVGGRSDLADYGNPSPIGAH